MCLTYSARLLYEACRFVGQSLFTSSEDKDHSRMIYRLSEQAILSAKAGWLLASVSFPFVRPNRPQTQTCALDRNAILQICGTRWQRAKCLSTLFSSPAYSVLISK